MDTRPRRRSLITVGQKLKVLEKLDRGESVMKVALDFGFGITTVRDIKNQRWKLLGDARPSNRKSLRESHPHFEGLEELLYWWLQKRQAEGLPVSGTTIMKQALEFHRILGIKDKFVASPGWLCKFKQRYAKREMGQPRGKAAVKLRTDFSASSTSKLNKAVLKECWLHEPQFQHFRPDSQNKYVAYCTVCFKTVKLSSKGRRALKRHVESKIHKKRLTLQEEENYTVHIYRDEDEKPIIKQLWEDDDPLMVPVEAATRSHSRVRNCYSEEMAAPAPDPENVDTGVPLQFEVINVPNLDQWRDVPVETNGLEPIATAEKNICRLCVKNEGRLPIFQDDGHVRVLALQIMALSNVKVSSSDGLPSHICSECVAMVHSCFNFKVQCETSDAMLRATLVTSAMTIQDGGDNKNCDIAVISCQLNETRDKIDTLMSSMRDLQKLYDSLHNSPAPAPVVPATAPSVLAPDPAAAQPVLASVPAAFQPISVPVPVAFQPVSVPVAFQPGSAPVPAAFQPGSAPVPASFQPGSAPVPAAFQPGSAPVPAAFQPGSAPVPAAFQLGSAPVPAAFQLGSAPVPAAFQPGSAPVPAAFQPVSAPVPAGAQPVSARVPSVHLGAGSAVEEHKYFRPCEVVDVSDDEDSTQDYPEFKGFSFNKHALGKCDKQRKVSQNQGDVKKFLDLPHYYIVELDDVDFERKFDPIKLMQT